MRSKLKNYTSTDKIYLKKNHYQEIVLKHHVSDDLIDFIFDPKKIIGINQNLAYEERIDVMIQAEKNKKLKVILQFDPIMSNQKQYGKVGIITAFFV